MKYRRDGIPRRIDCTLHTPAEAAITRAIAEVEKAGAHTLLTEAVVLLSNARELVSDFADGLIE